MSRYNRLGKSLSSFLFPPPPPSQTSQSLRLSTPSHIHTHLPLRASLLLGGNLYALSRRRAIVAHAVPRLHYYYPLHPSLNLPPPRFLSSGRPTPSLTPQESQTTTTTTAPWILASTVRPRRVIHSNMAINSTTTRTSTHCPRRACHTWDPVEPTAPPTLYTCRLL